MFYQAYVNFEFVLGFFSIVFVGYTILNKCRFEQLAKIWLVCASLYFYVQESFGYMKDEIDINIYKNFEEFKTIIGD